MQRKEKQQRSQRQTSHTTFSPKIIIITIIINSSSCHMIANLKFAQTTSIRLGEI